MPTSFDYLDHPGPIPFAHRGWWSEAPETTLPAFERAIDLGYRYLETDVQVTNDGVLVAFHDEDLARTTGRVGHIDQLPWSEVRTSLVDGKEPIPLLKEDLLGSFPECRVTSTPRPTGAVDALVAALRRTDAVERACVAAFSVRRIRRLRALYGSSALHWHGHDRGAGLVVRLLAADSGRLADAARTVCTGPDRLQRLETCDATNRGDRS